VQCWAEVSPNSLEWLANYVSPEDAKDLGPELQWVSGQTMQNGLFVYTLPQQAKDLGLSQLDQFRRGVAQFGQDVKNLPRDIANTRVGMPGDVQQGDVGPQIDITGGGNDRMPPTGSAVVTPPLVAATPYGPVPVRPGVVVLGAPILSSRSDSDGSRDQIGGNKILDLSDAAKAPDPSDRSGELTGAGRALQKHGGRNGSAFPAAKGNPATINDQGQKIVDDILNDPGKIVTQRDTGRFGNVIDVTASDGRGVRFSVDGKFITFLEPIPK
jgi:hypothetical protein